MTKGVIELSKAKEKEMWKLIRRYDVLSCSDSLQDRQEAIRIYIYFQNLNGCTMGTWKENHKKRRETAYER